VSATGLYWIDPTTRALIDAWRTRRRSMTTSTSGGSAQIYQFPPRGRFAVNAGDNPQLRINLEAQALPKVASGSGWYHDAAIQDERSRGN
jgi:Protein of unknown function (DUF2735)